MSANSTTTPNEAALPAGAADETYHRFLAQGTFRIQRCDDCQKAVFYPRTTCPHCGSQSLAWFDPSGQGTVYSTTTVRSCSSTHNVCLVDLDEGPRLMSAVIGIDSDTVQIGLRVKARVMPATSETSPLLVFERADQ
ncbi:Zn-ribbon domain-containing OB-fold protein [Tardiphaga sp. 803_E3_N1_3]|uniref:Zn-ribbon domain-containing OB-fold protein n=1 Tax=Tardiphaga sp. 803_E3_N1_3 TaxID=3240785 RepID=UPI003F1F0625